MLTQLSIKNLVLIETLELECQSGLTVLTGETGAGKSILLDGIGLVLGARAESRMVRHGAEKCSIIATFDISTLSAVQTQLNEYELDHEGELIIRRTLSADGKSKAYLNDQPVSVNLLKTLGTQLMEIHGQHDQRGLLDPTTHLNVLNDYIADNVLLSTVNTRYHAWKEAITSYERLIAQIEKARQDAEYNQHAYDELSALSPQIGEEEELAATRTAMQHQEQIISTMGEALAALQQPHAATQPLARAEAILNRLPDGAAKLAESATSALDRAHIELQEAIAEVEVLAEGSTFNVNALEAAEERLFALRDMARKHRCTVDELPEKCEALRKKITTLATSEAELTEAQQAITTTRADFLAEAQILSQKRQAAGAALEKTIQAELATLKMERAHIEISLTTSDDETDWHEGGIDRAQFVASTNPGSTAGPLHKIASGGELSRFMLACKMALSSQHGVSSMIFDEIDTGVGGAVADKIGNRLHALANSGNQVFCVTHLPQVAAYGHHHLMVQKDQQASTTTTAVTTLDATSRETEIARMLAGEDITIEATAAAKKLLEAAA